MTVLGHTLELEHGGPSALPNLLGTLNRESDMDYYVQINGETKGPLTIQQLRCMLDDGEITGQTLFVRKEPSGFL